MKVSVLEIALEYCVVFHDGFPQPGQDPVLILAGQHVHSNLLKPWSNVATCALSPTFHPAAKIKLILKPFQTRPTDHLPRPH